MFESVVSIEKQTEDNVQEIRAKKATKCGPNMGGYRFYECPFGFISHETSIVLQLLTLEENPPNIYPGGKLQQPHWYIEAIKIYKEQKTEWLKTPNP